MVKVCFLHLDGREEVVEATEGFSVMEVALNHGIAEIIADCGGALSCATCHVYLEGDWFTRVGPLADAENELLEFAIDRRANSRLSCQITLASRLDGLLVGLPEKQQ